MTQTLVLEYDQLRAEQECPLMYVEIPENEVGPGDQVEIRLWGPAENLQGWSLCVYGESLGAGELQSLANPGYLELVDLVEGLEAQLEYPAMRLQRCTAVTPLVYVDPETPCPPHIWRPSGADASDVCARKGYSCVQLDCPRPLYGSLEVAYERVASYLRWFWTIPRDGFGDVWFFLYDDVTLEPYRKFAVELPALAVVEQGVRNLSIRTADFATDADVPNAEIYLDGQLAGATDAQGLLHLQNVPTGQHQFKAVAAGYLPTDEDGLSNDVIVVK